MRLNELTPAAGSRKTAKRVGRGMGSGAGKTAGRGHKGQTSRSGGKLKAGFEGGQMPLQRRLPKRGFRSRKSKTYSEVRLGELGRVAGDVIDLVSLRDASLIGHRIERVKVIATGGIDRAVTLRGVAATSAAREQIEKAGGKVE
jgi:large subunit ribosomal protein L15